MDQPTHTAAPVDGCPACVLNVEPPQRTEPTPDGIRAHYQCTDCGHQWHTSWANT